MTEWPKVPDSKSGVPAKGTVGSNPTLSAGEPLRGKLVDTVRSRTARTLRAHKREVTQER
jgi:hypothetical protein